MKTALRFCLSAGVTAAVAFLMIANPQSASVIIAIILMIAALRLFAYLIVAAGRAYCREGDELMAEVNQLLAKRKAELDEYDRNNGEDDNG